MPLKTRKQLPHLYYPEADKVQVINAHNFEEPAGGIGFGDELLVLRAPGGLANLGTVGGTATNNNVVTVVADTNNGGVSAFNFVSGSSQYLSIADTGFNLSGDCSFGCWVNVDVLTGVPIVASKGPGTSDRNWVVFLASGGSLRWQVNNNPEPQQARYVISAATWYLMAGTYDAATNAAKLYINGSLADTKTTTSDTKSTTAEIQIGASTSQGLYFTGRQDDIRLSDRVWTSGEIASWYAAGRGYNA